MHPFHVREVIGMPVLTYHHESRRDERYVAFAAPILLPLAEFVMKSQSLAFWTIIHRGKAYNWYVCAGILR
jgi:ABC-type uncharacterized transport system YnjBCD permease subunit